MRSLGKGFVIGVVLVSCTSGGVVNTTTISVDADPPGPDFSMTTTESSSTTAPQVVTITTTADFVRFIHPDEWTRVMESCMIDAGWPVTTTPDGGIMMPERPEDQNPVLEADWDLCSAKYPVDPKYRQPLSVEQLSFLYNWFLEVSIPCLEGEGYDNFDPPSLDVFIDTYDTEGWSPYRDLNLDQLPSGGFYSLNEACPQNPPVDELYGSGQ